MPRTRSSSPARKGSRDNPWLIPSVLAVLISIMVVGLLYLFHLSRTASSPLDQVTLCRSDQPPVSVTVVLLDLTDALTLEEKTQISHEFSRIQRNIPRHGLLEVYFLHRDINETRRPVFQACNPGDGSDMNHLYQNPELAQFRWNREFSERLDHAFASSFGLESSDRSLIFEAIRIIAVNVFGKPELDGVPKNLVLISDLLQHNPGVYTQYRAEIEPFSAFSSLGYFHQNRADLSGVSVQVFYVTRPATRRFQGRAHVEFWIAYLEHKGGQVSNIKRLLGD